MSLMEQIPNPEAFFQKLKDLIGDDGKGLTGAHKILTSQDFSQLSGPLISALEELIGVDFPENVEELIKAPIEKFPEILAKIPSDPSKLTGPLLGGFSDIQKQFSGNILGTFGNLGTGLGKIKNLTGQDSSNLIPLNLDAIFDKEKLGTFNFLKIVKKLFEELGEDFLDFPHGVFSVETWFVSYAHDFISYIEIYFGSGITKLFEEYQLQLLNILDSGAVKQINEIKYQLRIYYKEAKTQIEGGNTEDLEKLRSAVNYLEYLKNYLLMRMNLVQTNLESEKVNPDTFSNALQKEFERLTNDPLLALSDFKRKLNHLFQNVASQIKDIDLERVSRTVNEAFDTLNGLIGEFNIDQLRETLTAPFTTLKDSIQAINNQVIFITVEVRNIFTGIRDTLKSAAATLGTYDEKGKFHFNFESVITNFLNQLKTNINDLVKPKLEEFRDNTITPVFTQVENLLSPALKAVEDTRKGLESLLENFLNLLKGLNISDVLETVRDKLESMLEQLGTIEFDPITDPVIDEIDNMKDQLSQIDVSSLNDLLRKALGAAVKVIKDIDFQKKITGVIMEEMDKILDIPKDAMEELASQADEMLSKINAIKPEMIIKPLVDIFEPFFSLVEGLSINRVLEPVNTWYGKLLEKIDEFAPGQLLAPLVKPYEGMLSAFDKVSPGQLIQPIQEALDQVASFLDEIDLSSVTKDLAQEFQKVFDGIDSINPGKLLDPVIAKFQLIEKKLDEFNPLSLLKPVDQVVDSIKNKITALSKELLDILKKTLESFTKRIDYLDPTRIFQRLNSDFADVNQLFQELDSQQIIADLNGPYQELRSAFRSSTANNPEMESLINSLNPIPALSEISTTYQSVKGKFDDRASKFEPGKSTSFYKTLKPKLGVLLPLSSADEMSFEFIIKFLENSRPSSFLGGLNDIYETLKNQFRSLDPQQVKDRLQETFERIKGALAQLDITKILDEVNSLFDEMKNAIKGINLDFIKEELEGLVQEVRNILEGLDPRILIDPMNELLTEVKDVFSVVSPQTIFAPLEKIVERIKKNILAFHPETFEKPLQDSFKEVKRIISEIDVRIVLKPLTDRLEQIRSELKEELDKVAQAFGTMIAAIPV